MFGGGGGGMDSRRMKKMMNQMGIDVEEMDDVEEVVIKTKDKKLVIEQPDVTAMDAQGQTTYQVVGEPKEEDHVDPEDVKIVAQKADVDEETAEAKLIETDGDLAAAISELK
ncbi:MAG: nascent polypeptide-associated complex protein [Halobacteria archaeon]